MGYARSWEDFVLEDRVLRAQYLNVVMKLCCLSNRTRRKDNKISSEERKWE